MTGLFPLCLSVVRELGRPDPQIRGAGVKVELQVLSWRTDTDLAQVLRVVLLVVGGDFSGLTTSRICLLKYVLLDVCSAANSVMTYAMLSLLMNLVAYKVGTLLGWANVDCMPLVVLL